MASLAFVPLLALMFGYLSHFRADPFFSKDVFDLDAIARCSVNKTILVTGANSGLGFSSVRSLARAGTAGLVVMGCRSLQRCEEARASILKEHASNTTLVALHLDLSSIDSVKQFANEVQSALSRSSTSMTSGISSPPALDVLINNAGIMGSTYSLTTDTGVEIQMQVNHLGHFALTSLLLRNLEASTIGSRVVSVSSLLGSIGPAFQIDDMNFQKRGWMRRTKLGRLIQSFTAYAASKRANLLFTHGMNKRFSEPDTDV